MGGVLVTEHLAARSRRRSWQLDLSLGELLLSQLIRKRCPRCHLPFSLCIGYSTSAGWAVTRYSELSFPHDKHRYRRYDRLVFVGLIFFPVFWFLLLCFFFFCSFLYSFFFFVLNFTFHWLWWEIYFRHLALTWRDQLILIKICASFSDESFSFPQVFESRTCSTVSLPRLSFKQRKREGMRQCKKEIKKKKRTTRRALQGLIIIEFDSKMFRESSRVNECLC